MIKLSSLVLVLALCRHHAEVKSFQSAIKFRVKHRHQNQHLQQQHSAKHYTKKNVALQATGSNKEMSIEELKSELRAYLKKRDESDANESAKSEVGKVIGGTKGNAILEYVSGAPNKPIVIDEVPDIFDYTELAKYGFSYLATPIMNAGGRREMYSLMELPEPAMSNRIKKPKKVRKPIIDRTGETDQARYSGLKVTQIMDDDEMGKKLAEFEEKKKRGEAMKPKLVEEEYVMPFADKRNTGPQQTPDWTPEMLDEEGKRVGRAMSWAREARAGEFKTDPFELLSIEGWMQFYSIITTLIVTFAFGKSSSKLMEDVLLINKSEVVTLLELMKVPALGFVAASVGSAVFCAAILAPEKNRNPFIWGVKGFAGGPLTIAQLKNLDTLITRGEAEAAEKAEV